MILGKVELSIKVLIDIQPSIYNRLVPKKGSILNKLKIEIWKKILYFLSQPILICDLYSGDSNTEHLNTKHI